MSSGADKARIVFSSLGELKNPAARKGKCLFDLCYGLADNGVGRRATRRTWHDGGEKNYVTLTRVDVHVAPRTLLKRGTAYGIFTWNGVAESTERRLSSTCKRDWRWALAQPTVLSRSPPPKTTAATATTAAAAARS